MYPHYLIPRMREAFSTVSHPRVAACPGLSASARRRLFACLEYDISPVENHSKTEVSELKCTSKEVIEGKQADPKTLAVGLRVVAVCMHRLQAGDAPLAPKWTSGMTWRSARTCGTG